MNVFRNPKLIIAFLVLIGLAFAAPYLMDMFGGNAITTVPDKKNPVIEDTKPKPNVKVPDFSADSTYAFVAKQVSFGPRVTNSAAHKACKKWLVQKLKSYGAIVLEQNFQAKRYDGIPLNGTNIIAQINPTSTKRIALAAHWDSRHIADKDADKAAKNKPILGADDGASGVAVLLEIARQAQANPVGGVGLDLILFDAEDLGKDAGNEPGAEKTWCLGSQYWAKNPHVANYKAEYGILLDMVGAKNARFPVEGYSESMAVDVVRKVWNTASTMGYGNYFVPYKGNSITDDHFYMNEAGIKTADIINMDEDYSFGDYHHTHKDNMDIIDPKTLKAVGQVILTVIYTDGAILQ